MARMPHARGEQRRQRLRDEHTTQPLEGWVEASLDEKQWWWLTSVSGKEKFWELDGAQLWGENHR